MCVFCVFVNHKIKWLTEFAATLSHTQSNTHTRMGGKKVAPSENPQRQIRDWAGKHSACVFVSILAVHLCGLDTSQKKGSPLPPSPPFPLSHTLAKGNWPEKTV